MPLYKLKHKIIPIALCCAMAMSFTSCMINSTLTDIPLIEEKNQVVASVGASIPMPTAIATCAYGLTDKFATQTRISIDTNSNVSFQQSIGLYKKYNARKKTELYLGYMFGKGMEDTSFYAFINVDKGPYHMFFIQYNIGNTNKAGWATSGVSFKGGYIRSRFIRNYNMYFNPDSAAILYGSAYFFSPTVFAQFGKGDIRFNIHAQLQFLLNYDVQFGISCAPFNFGMSVQYHFKNKNNYALYDTKPMHTNEQLWKRTPRQEEFIEHPSNVSLTTGANLTANSIRTNSLFDTKTTTKLYYTPVISIAYDYALKPWYSFGLIGSFQRIKGDITDIPYYKTYGNGSKMYTDVKFMYSQYYIGLRPLFHVVHFEKLHVYLGLSCGIQYQTNISTGTVPEVPIDSIATRSIGYAILFQQIPVGIRYYLTDKIGITAELALGQPYFFSAGAVMRFK